MISPKPAAPASVLTPFRHSRLYAEGWNAARKSSRSPNPYKTEPERGRWAQGFAEALV